MENKVEIRNLNINSIIPYINNPRKNDGAAVDKVAASIKEFGFKVPIIVDKDNVVVTGHTRLKAAQKLGLKEVPTISAGDLSDAQIKAFRIADNRVAEESEWDFEKLAIEIEGITDIDILGFDEKELDFLNKDENEVVEDEFDAEPPEDPVTKLGDVWKLGRHRLICGDSTSVVDVEKLMNGARVDLLITDPPYNVSYEGKTKAKLTIQNDQMADDKFRTFLRDAFFAADSVMKGGAVFYIWHADSEGYNFRGACFDIGWQVRQCLIWNKNCMVMGRQDYHWKHEPCLYGWKDGAAHLWAADRKQTTVINFERPQRNGEHPTMKPVGLFDYQIKNNTKQEDVVLDLFAGSGTTLIACEQNGRTAYCAELDPRYCDVIIRRWEKLTGERAELYND